MRTILKISDAAVIALHAVDLMGANPRRPRSAAGIAGELGVSYNHLSKIMQRLTKAGFVAPIRGPKGGFALTARAGGASLREIIEAIEGPLAFTDCLMETKICGRSACLFSDFLKDANERLLKMLSQKVSVFAKTR
ncbi:MAG: Rrf2 family transcriptional regulator [Elusimicrobiales bacterium]|jgi:Rrf2 family protein